MKSTLHLVKTDAARLLLAGPRGTLSTAMRMLLLSIHGDKTLAEVQQLARGLNLGDDALRELRRRGLVACVERIG